MINHLPYGSDNIDLEITQSKIAPSIFSLRENISKSLIKEELEINSSNEERRKNEKS